MSAIKNDLGYRSTLFKKNENRNKAYFKFIKKLPSNYSSMII